MLLPSRSATRAEQDTQGRDESKPGLEGSRGSTFLRRRAGSFDQLPELWVLLQGLVLLHLQAGAEEEILQGVSVENAVNHQPQIVPFEIDPVVAHPKPVQRASGPLQFPELIQLGLHYLLGQ